MTVRIVCLLATVFWTPLLAAAKPDKRPLKTYFAKLQPEKDRDKVLAAHTPSGWTIANNMIIGPHSEKYIGAFEFDGLAPKWWLSSEFDIAGPLSVFGQFIIVSYRDGSLKRVDVGSGKVSWTANLGSYVSRETVLSGATLYAVTVRQQLYAIDFQTGEVKWLYEAGIPEDIVVSGGAAPVVEGNIVYFGTSYGEIHAVNALTGQELWRKDPKFSQARFVDVVGELFTYNSRLFLARYDGILASMKLGLGEPEVDWVETLPNITTTSFRNGRLYVGTLGGDIYAYELVNGRQVWKYQAGAPVSSLSILQDYLVAVGSKGRITFIELDSGRATWHDDLHGQFSAEPVIYDGSIFVFSGLGSVYGYKL